MRLLFSFFSIFSLTCLSALDNQDQDPPSFFEALELFINQSGQSVVNTDSNQAVTSSLKELLQEIKKETENNDPNQPLPIVESQHSANG